MIKTEKLKYIEEQVLMKKKIKKENIKRNYWILNKLVDSKKMIHSAKKQEQELESKTKLLMEIKAKEDKLRENYQKHQKHLLLKEKYDT